MFPTRIKIAGRKERARETREREREGERESTGMGSERRRRSLPLIHLLLSLLLMALISFLPSTPNTNTTSHSPHNHKRDKNTTTTNNNKKKKKIKAPPPPPKAPSSWEQFKSLLSCKNTTTTPSQLVHAPSPIKNSSRPKCTRLGSTCGSSICPILRDVVHGNTRITDHSSSSSSGSHVNDGTPLSSRSARSTTTGGGGGGMQLMKLSGCYECHTLDVHSVSRRYPRPRTLCPCAECGEVFTKTESLELHQAIRHAVSELGPDDSGRNIVEIIFKSSWQKKDNPICTIERILKVHNTQRTITKFEDYRDSVKARALAHLLPSHPRSKDPRCAADGNELLRFHCTSLSCSLGSNSSTSLCLSSTNSSPCSVCTVIRYGFSRAHQGPQGVLTTASSGRAHDWGPGGVGGPGVGRSAMLVCRVIAGRVKRSGDDVESSGALHDSVTGDGSREELFVVNPRAILPCFVVIYKALD